MTHDLEWRTVDHDTWEKYVKPKYYKWQSSMFMPKWASRRKHTLVNLRCERVQNITEEDAKVEGIIAPLGNPNDMSAFRPWTYKSEYQKLWDELNAKRGYPFSKNCFVWVLQWELGK
jgi:hypothetical protein